MIKKTWRILKRDWPDMLKWQQVMWVLLFPVAFLWLLGAIKMKLVTED